jgi:hypothetical protein
VRLVRRRGIRNASTFIGTVHRNSCGCYGVANQMRQGFRLWMDTGVNMTTGVNALGCACPHGSELIVLFG